MGRTQHGTQTTWDADNMGHSMQCAAWRQSRRCCFDVTWYKLARDTSQLTLYTDSARHRQASQLGREFTLCALRLATGDNTKGLCCHMVQACKGHT